MMENWNGNIERKSKRHSIEERNKEKTQQREKVGIEWNLNSYEHYTNKGKNCERGSANQKRIAEQNQKVTALRKEIIKN